MSKYILPLLLATAFSANAMEVGEIEEDELTPSTDDSCKRKLTLKDESRMLEIQSKSYTDPTNACIESAAWALDKPVSEVRRLSQINSDDIVTLHYVEGKYYKGYHAYLKNGDGIYCYYFVKGPLEGGYDCTRISNNKTMIPMDSEVYDKLRVEYVAKEQLRLHSKKSNNN